MAELQKRFRDGIGRKISRKVSKDWKCVSGSLVEVDKYQIKKNPEEILRGF